MPPSAWSPRVLLQPRQLNLTDPSTAADYFAIQWQNPGDILSVLLLLGPEIVQGAVAQLSGRALTPVAFSFGWVAYSARTLLNAFGGMALIYPILPPGCLFA